MPAPPDRWQCWPTCAQEPTVAQVSTIVPSPTCAPMLTKLGISTTSLPMCAPRRAIAPGTTRTPSLRKSASLNPSNRAGTLSQNGAGCASTNRISLTRKYSSTAFFNHALTRQPPSPSGSATRNSPFSRPVITRSTAGRVEPSISSGVSVARRSNALSIINLRSSTPGSVAGAFAGVLRVDLRAVVFGGVIGILHRGRRAARRAAPAVALHRARHRARRNRSW